MVSMDLPAVRSLDPEVARDLDLGNASNLHAYGLIQT